MFTLLFVLFPFFYLLIIIIIYLLYYYYFLFIGKCIFPSVFSQVYSLLIFSLFIKGSIQNVQETKVNPQI